MKSKPNLNPKNPREIIRNPKNPMKSLEIRGLGPPLSGHGGRAAPPLPGDGPEDRPTGSPSIRLFEDEDRLAEDEDDHDW